LSQNTLKNSDHLIIRLVSTVKGIVTVFVMISNLIVYNFCQILALIVVRPFSKRAFRAFIHIGADYWWRITVGMERVVHGVEVEFSGDTLPQGENAILVPNHQATPDIPFLVKLACRYSRAGDLKWFVKDNFRYVPGLGWGMLLLDNFFVKRNWSADRTSIEKTFAKLKKDKAGVWVVLFAEGTRLRPKALARSQRIARSRGHTVCEHVMLPHSRGFAATLDGLDGHLDAVYDVTISYPGGLPSMGQYLLGSAKQAKMHVRRFAVGDIPKDRFEREEWLRARFIEKEGILKQFFADESADTAVEVNREMPQPAR
jgi:1-acyl-sn-glycerol-3-phosphate acyltransferase